MGNDAFVLNYVNACTTSKLPLSECGPVWQIGIIGFLLISAIAVLVVLRVRAYMQAGQS
jgi:hypothetical protein